MNENNDILVQSESGLGFRLRPIGDSDIKDLRVWKNRNKGSFFVQSDITSDQQIAWFAGFQGRPDDWMFVVEQHTAGGWQKIGCMGFRKLDDEECVDAYNIIRAKKIEPASFTMADVFRSMLKTADSKYPDLPIRCKVLIENPAVEWYERQGFSKIDRGDTYFLMELDKCGLTK